MVEKGAINSNASFLAYKFPREIFSDEKDLTKEFFLAINMIVREETKGLKNKYGFKKCTVICISLASSYGSIVYKDNPDINEIILVAPGENLAKDMWHGCRTQHFRKSFEKQGVTESGLIESWKDLASQNNLPALGTKVKMFFGRNDSVIPYRFSHTLGDTCRRSGLDVTIKSFPLGHYFLISYFLLLPKSFLSTPKML